MDTILANSAALSNVVRLDAYAIPLLLAGSSRAGVQVGRRKPVIQDDLARETLAGSPTAGDGRVREVTNGSFGAAKLVECLGT